jgi:hypothetical protein
MGIHDNESQSCIVNFYGHGLAPSRHGAYIYKLLKVLFLRDIKFHVLVFKHASRGVVFLHCPIFNEKLIEGDTLVFVHHYHG